MGVKGEHEVDMGHEQTSRLSFVVDVHLTHTFRVLHD